jgi:glycosyltransferase involved in cell wall biosynthesis
MSNKPRVWTINGDFVALEATGVARYAREVTVALDELIAERHPLAQCLEINVLAPRPTDDLRLRSIPFQVLPEFSRPRLPQFWVQAQLPRHITGGLLSFCNLAPVFLRRHIVCVHDVHTWLMPKSYGRLFRLAHRVALPMLGRNAAFITTVSKLSRDHLCQNGIAPMDKIVVTYNGSDHVRQWCAKRSCLTIGPRPFVMCLGRPQNYKNGELIWRIAPQLDLIGLDIYMAGAIDQATLATFGPRKPDNVRLLGRVSDDDLARMFSHALCFAFPSRIEGFGLPAVESMALSCPVVASSAPCLPEVCGDAALYADPDDAAGWVRQIGSLNREPGLRATMITKGLARAGQFTWRRVAEVYLELMQRVDSDGAGINRVA